MTDIEQAVFSSDETEKMAGYQILGTSPGLLPKDLKELTTWGPSHGSLLGSGPDASSFNFHRLPSGAYCVSRTTAAGAEYSGRGGLRVYTQNLVLPPSELARFANNPFAVLRAALAGGDLVVHDKVPRKLEPIRLLGRAAAVDSALLARLHVKPGIEWLGRIIEAALNSPQLVVAGSPTPEHVIAGLINCLPPECRTEFSFSTGLLFSPRRPFRIMAMPVDEASWRQRRHLLDATIFDLSQDPPDDMEPIAGWGRLVTKVLGANQSSFLAAQFSKRRFELSVEDLPALALQLLEEWEAARLPSEKKAPAKSSPEDPAKKLPDDWLDTLQRAHAAHNRFERSGGTGSSTAIKPELSHIVASPESNCPDVLRKLEKLDDIIFSAIGGSRAALDELRILWPKLREQLGDELLAESREQYLRHALLIWQGSVESSGTRDSETAIEALEVLSIIFEDD
ncbi:MAG: hypothetical protein JXM70_15075 [Pirellulales bacterium]|nr:hypothetical protein [Pirellulales bacterium]